MKGAQVSKYGDVDDVLTFTSNLEKPSIRPGSGNLLIKVSACSLGRHDTYTLSGKVRAAVKCKFPYIPGMDICGTVEEVDSVKPCNFKKGDVVIGNNGDKPFGGLAEYMLLDARRVTLKPKNINEVEGAALGSTTNMTAYQAVFQKAKVQHGERVLVIGGSGGVGSSCIQFAKVAGAYVVTTSTAAELCKSIGADRVVNYREENWWEIEEFISNKFDVIIDTLGKDKACYKAHFVTKPAKRKGRFIAVAITDEPQVTSVVQIAKLFVPAIAHQMKSSFKKSRVPKYIMMIENAKPEDREDMKAMVEAGKERAVVDTESPYPFTIEGVKSAYKHINSGHAHGKVVVTITS